MTIEELDPVARVVDRIYDAGMGQADWSEVIGDISALLGRGQAVLEFLDYNSGAASVLGVHGYDIDRMLVDSDLFLANDPWARRLAWNFAGEHVLGSALLNNRERRSDFFVNELAPLLGMETKDILATFITRTCDRRGAKAAVGALMINSGETQETFTDADLRLVQHIRPHLVKSLEMQARLNAANTMLDAAAAAVDRGATAFWLLNNKGQVLYANATAIEMQRESHFAMIGQHLHFADPVAETALQRAIASARSFSLDSGAFVAHARDRRRPLNVLVAPVSAAAVIGLTDGIDYPCVAVSIADARPDLQPKLKLMQSLYLLTDAELRVLARIADGDRPAEAADGLGLSVWTVRTHLRSIMDKTHCRSQRDLVLLVSSGVP